MSMIFISHIRACSCLRL